MLRAFADERSPPAVLPTFAASELPECRGADPPILKLMVQQLERSRQMPSYESSLAAFKLWVSFCEREDIVYASELNLSAQERFILDRQQDLVRRGWTASNASINRYMAFLGVTLRQAWKRGLIPTVPYVKRLANPPPRDVFLTAEQAHQLLTACTSRYLYRFVLLALHTLQRPKSIFELRTSQVDFTHNRIAFLPPGTVQSNKRRPMIPITPTLHDELRMAVEESRSGYVLEMNGLPLKSVKNGFRNAVKRAGLPSTTTPYVLRHTGATLLSAAGIPMQQIASMLGHTTQRTTEIYAKRRPEFLSEAVDALNGIFGIGTLLPPESVPSGNACLPKTATKPLTPMAFQNSLATHSRTKSARWTLVPLIGIEPTTPSLRIVDTCSTMYADEQELSLEPIPEPV